MALPPAVTQMVDCDALRDSPAMVDACEFGKVRNFSVEPSDLQDMAEKAGVAAARSACATVTYGASEVAAQMGIDPCGKLAQMVTGFVFTVASRVVSGVKGMLGLKPSKSERVDKLTGDYRHQMSQLLLGTLHTQLLMQQALDQAAREAVEVYDLVLPEYRGQYTAQMAKERLSAMGLPLVNEWVALPAFAGPRFEQLVPGRQRLVGKLAPDLYRVLYQTTDAALEDLRLGSALNVVVDTQGRSVREIERAWEAAMGWHVMPAFERQDDLATAWFQQLEVLGALLVAYVGERAGARIRLEHAQRIEQLQAQAAEASRAQAFWEAAYREQQLYRQRKLFADVFGLLLWGGGSYASYRQQWGWKGYVGSLAAGLVVGRVLRGKSPEQRFAEAVAQQQAEAQAAEAEVQKLHAPRLFLTG